MYGKNFKIYGVPIPRKYIESRHFYLYAPVPSYSKLTRKFLLLYRRYREITHSPRQHFFENLFPPTAERGGENYDLLYQKPIRKYVSDLEH